MHTHDPQGEMYCIHSVSCVLSHLHTSLSGPPAIRLVCMCMHAFRPHHHGMLLCGLHSERLAARQTLSHCIRALTTA